MSRDRIPVYAPVLGAGELHNLRQCLADGALIHGAFVRRFEEAIARTAGRRHAVGTNSGTAALHLALRASGIGAGDEVFVTALTFIAPANAIAYVGAHPIFVDVDAASYQMDAGALRRFIDERCRWDGAELTNMATGRRVAGIVAVHFGGMMADMDAISAIAARYGLSLIEDACPALGSSRRGRPAGGIAPVGCFSFHASKVITAGGGGMLVTDDEEVARKVRYWANQARDDAVEGAHDEVGFNYRMTNLHGAIGCAQVERLAGHIATRRAIHWRYAAGLADVAGITVVRPPADQAWNGALINIRVDATLFGLTARELMQRLAEQDIEALPLHQPLHRSRAHRGASCAGGDIADMLARETLSLPGAGTLRETDQGCVIEAIRTAADICAVAAE